MQLMKWNRDNFGCIMVSHYERLFELVPPSHVHVLVNGKIILSGGKEVVEKLIKKVMTG